MGNTKITHPVDNYSIRNIPAGDNFISTLPSDYSTPAKSVEPKGNLIFKDSLDSYTPAKSVEPKGNLIFKDTLEVAAPTDNTTKQTPATSSSFLDWVSSFFDYFSSTNATPPVKIVENISTPAPLIQPKVEAPSQQEIKLLESMNNVNQMVQTIEEDLKDHPEAHVYRRIVSLFKEVIALNEQLAKTSIEDNLARNEIIKKLGEKYKDLRTEISSLQTKETIAKTAQTALNLFALGTIVFLAGSAVFTNGLTLAAIPAALTAASTGFPTVKKISTLAQAGTLIYRTHLENKLNTNRGELLQRTHDQDTLYSEIKTSHTESNQLYQQVTNLWGKLSQIDEKRHEIKQSQE